MTYFDLIRIIWHRRSLFALGIVIALVIAALYYARAIPIYESTAEVLVVQKRPELVANDQIYAARQTDDYLSTHTVLVRSPVIIDRAISEANLDQLETFTNEKYRDERNDLTTEFAERLVVDAGSRQKGRGAQNILSISFRGPVPRECALAVQSILNSYQEFIDEAYRNMGEDTMNLIAHARDDLQQNLTIQEEAYRTFRQESPLLMEDFKPGQDRLTAIETQLSDLLLRETNVEAQMQSIQVARTSGRSEQELVALVSSLANRADRDSRTVASGRGLDSELFSLLQREQRLRQDFGPNHPSVVSVRKQIEGTRSFFALPNAAYQSVMEDSSGETVRDPVTLYEKFLEQELSGIRVSKDLLMKLYDRERETAKEQRSFELKAEGYKRNIARTQSLYDTVIGQLQDASLVKDYGGFDARVISPPALGKKVTPKALFVFPVAMILGGLLGCVMAFSAEAVDRRFRSAEEVKRYLGVPILGHVAECYPIHPKELRDPKLDRMLYAYHQPGSTATEAFRAVRTALYFNAQGKSHRIVQVTSAGPGDGKSTLTSNLAVCIAQSGKSVLLIDADLRRPRMHKVFSLKNVLGLASVIGLDVELSDAIAESGIPNLSILPSGQVPPDPSELLSSQRFTQLLETVREKYDYVLVDTGPVLAITDPCIVASRVDGVIISLRMAQNSRSQSKRAQEILSGVGANVLGVFIVGARDRAAASYDYGYGYGPQYVYTPHPAETNGSKELEAQEKHRLPRP